MNTILTVYEPMEHTTLCFEVVSLEPDPVEMLAQWGAIHNENITPVHENAPEAVLIFVKDVITCRLQFILA